MTKKNTDKKSSADKTPIKKAKASSPKRTKNVKKNSPLIRSIFGLFLLLAIVISTFFAVHKIFPPENEVKKPDKIKETDQIQYEIFPVDEEHFLPKADTTLPDEPAILPEVAIIIDDMGYNKSIANKFANLEKKLTFSVLPNSPHKREIATNAHNKGLEIMLHLPMEPFEYPRIDPGPFALLVSMTPDEITAQLSKDIATIPFAKGVNNHMGSRMTTMSSKMYQIFTILKKEDLFFIDSRTSSQSLCKPSARLLQISFAQRDVFLDHFQTADAIRRQIRNLIRKAVKNGSAIGIAHPHKTTYEVLKEELPFMRKKIRIVHASELVKTLG